MKAQNPISHRLFSGFTHLLRHTDAQSPAKQIHKLRTTARRIEALTDYLPKKLRDKNKALLDEVHSIRKRSGKVRDLDVQLELLKKVGADTHNSQFEALENRLLDQRERRATKLNKKVQSLRRKKWLERLDKLDAGVAEAVPDGTKSGAPLQAAKEQLRILAARYPDSVSMVDPEELHQLRIELKKVRYTAELSGKDRATRLFTQALERTQDAIGAWHDWLTLSESAEEALNNYVSSGILMQLRSLTTSAFSAAIQSVTALLSAQAAPAAPAKKSPRSATAKTSTRRTA